MHVGVFIHVGLPGWSLWLLLPMLLFTM